MKQWLVKYNLETAPRTFYPYEVSVQAKDSYAASRKAKQIIAENTNMEQIDKIIITEVIPTN